MAPTMDPTAFLRAIGRVDRQTGGDDVDAMRKRVNESESMTEPVEHPNGGYETGRRNLIGKVLTVFHCIKVNAEWSNTVPEELRAMFEEVEDAMQLVAAVRAVARHTKE